MTKMAADAASARQALVGSFVSQQAAQAAATQTYADSMARVVGPQQKLAGAAMQEGRIREKRDDQLATAKQRGSDDVAYRAGKRADEAKLVLAKQTLGADIANQTADRRQCGEEITVETARHHQDRRRRGPRRTREKRERDAQDDATPNQYGVPAASGRADDHRHARRSSPTSRPRVAAPPSRRVRSGSRRATRRRASRNSANCADGGGAREGWQGLHPGHTRSRRSSTRQGRGKKILGYAPLSSKLKHPALVDAAVDAMYDGFINRPRRSNALKQAGYKPSEVATALGVKTSGQVKKAYTGPH
jgi:hypothetical protein